MAITRTAGAWTAGSTSVTPPLPATPQAGDLHVIYIGGKPYSITIGTLAGWTLITGTDGANGTVAQGIDVGSVHWAAFYRYWQSGDDETPTWTITSGNVVLAVAVRFRPTAGSTINTPVGCKGWDNTSGTGYSATMDANPGITAADVLNNFTTIAGNNSTFGTPTMSATGATLGTKTENPTTEGTTTTGNDLEASASTCVCSSGDASAAPVVGWTLSVAQTGGGAFVRIRETANHALTANGITTGAPVLATPTIAQVHGLGATGISASPVVGTPTLWSGGIDELEANGIAVGGPTVGVPTIHQTHALLSVAIAAGVPSVGNPTMGQLHGLQGPAGFGFGAPTLGIPSMAQAHALVASGFAVAAPQVGNPTMGQLHVLTAQGIATGAPVVELPPTLGIGGEEEEELPGGPGSARVVFIRSHR